MKYNWGAKRLKKSIVVLSILFALIMILPSFSIAHSPNRPNSYTQDGFTISFLGAHAEIQMNGSGYTAYWSIEILSNKGLNLQDFNTTGIKSIVTAQQNSVVLTVENHNFKAAEIYSFGGGSIDASIALENTRTVNTSYIATFVLITNHRDHVNISGFSGSSLNIPVNQRPVLAVINQHSWLYNDQHIHLSWKSSMGLFHGGLMTSSVSNNLISLPFGPFDLSKNSTYSIDPTITPDKFIGGGGGGGSGGGNPSISTNPLSVNGNYVTTTYNSFVAGTQSPIHISGELFSMGGASKVTIGYYAVVATNGANILLHTQDMTSIGSFGWTWGSDNSNPTVPGDYSGIRVKASSSYGATSLLQGPEVKIYDTFLNSGSAGPIDAAATIPVYDVGGGIYGYDVLQVESGLNLPLEGGVSSITSLITSFVPSSGSPIQGIGSWSKSFDLIGNSANKTGNNYVDQNPTGAFQGAGSNDSWGPLEWALFSALLMLIPGEFSSVTAMLDVIGVVAFHSVIGPISFDQGNDFSVSAGTANPYFLKSGSLSPNWIFNYEDTLQFVGGNSTSTINNVVLNYFTYTGSFQLVLPITSATIGTTFSEPIYFAEYSTT